MSSREPNHTAYQMRWLVLILAGLGTFMTTLDVSIINVALPTLGQQFGAPVSISQWFVLSYTFVITVTLLLFGKLGDIYGRRRMYEHGALVFVAGSLLCGLSTSALMLILARALQGIGAAIIMSSGPAMVTAAFPARERGKALGFIGTAVALGLLVGPVAGGFIIQFTSWRWIFLINIPIGLFMTWYRASVLRNLDNRNGGTVDLAGAGLMALALASIMFALVLTLPWWSEVTLAAAGGLLLGWFVVVERRVEHPILDLDLFRDQRFSIGSITGWANYAAIMPVSVYMPFYLERLLGYNPGLVGITLAAGPLTLGLVGPLSGSLSDRIGPRVLTTLGLIILSIGMLSLSTLTTDSTWTDVIWRLVLANFGSALFVSPNSSSIMSTVDRAHMGVASATVALVRNLGMLSGVTIAGAIMVAVSPAFTLEGLRATLLMAAVLGAMAAVLSVWRTKRG